MAPGPVCRERQKSLLTRVYVTRSSLLASRKPRTTHDHSAELGTPQIVPGFGLKLTSFPLLPESPRSQCLDWTLN